MPNVKEFILGIAGKASVEYDNYSTKIVDLAEAVVVDRNTGTITDPSAIAALQAVPSLGPYADAAALEAAKPAESNPGKAAYVGASAPYAIWDSNGTAWVERGAGVFAPSRSTPYLGEVFGDSRSKLSNIVDYTMPAAGVPLVQDTTFTHAMRLLGDVQPVADFGLSGDKVATWKSTSRNGGKTYKNWAASKANVCFYQFGINDIGAWVEGSGGNVYATFRDNQIALHKACISEALKAGKKVVVDAIYVNTIGDGGGYGTNSIKKHQMLGEINAALALWLAYFPGQAVFVPQDTSLIDVTGYAKPEYMDAAGVHLNIAGARIQARRTAEYARRLLPRRPGPIYTVGGAAPNLINWGSATVLRVNPGAGSATVGSITSGYDAGGFYYELLFTPMTLGTAPHDYTQMTLQVHANVGTYNSNVPEYDLSNGAKLVSGCRVVVDDGAGGQACCNHVNVGLYLFRRTPNAAIGTSYGGTTAVGATAQPASRYVGPYDEACVLQPLTVDAEMTDIDAPAASKGLYLQVQAICVTTGVAQRIRIYNPFIIDQGAAT